MSINRDRDRIRDWKRRGAKRYRDKVKREVLSGERDWNSVPPVNSDRKAKRYERDFGDWADEVRMMACHWCGKPGPSDPAHARSRGSGGDKRDLLPACRECHRAFDEYRLGVDHDQAIADARELYDSYHEGET